MALVAGLVRDLGITERIAACFHDGRDPRFVEHSLGDLLRQRVFGLCQMIQAGANIRNNFAKK